jgi:hypothetical protein
MIFAARSSAPIRKGCPAVVAEVTGEEGARAACVRLIGCATITRSTFLAAQYG